MILNINGKEYKLKITWFTYRRILKRAAGMTALPENTPLDKIIDMRGRHLINNLWDCLPRGVIFKPFIFKWRLFKKITPKELFDSDKIIAEAISLEDREKGNSVTPKPGSS